MAKFKVVCSQGDYAYTFDTRASADLAVRNHKRRKRHSPVYIYKIEDQVDMTRTELLAFTFPDPNVGILEIIAV